MAFWKPGTVAPGVNRPAVSLTSSSRYDERTEDDGALSAVYNPATKLSLPAQRRSLPIFQNRMHILYLVEKYPTVIIVGTPPARFAPSLLRNRRTPDTRWSTFPAIC